MCCIFKFLGCFSSEAKHSNYNVVSAATKNSTCPLSTTRVTTVKLATFGRLGRLFLIGVIIHPVPGFEKAARKLVDRAFERAGQL